MGAEGIPYEKSSMLRRKAKILPNPLLGSYKLEKTTLIRLQLRHVFLMSVTKGVLNVNKAG